MTAHRVIADLSKAQLETTGQIMETAAGFLFGWGTADGNGVEGWAPGAMFINTGDTQLMINEGTVTSTTWVVAGSHA